MSLTTTARYRSTHPRVAADHTMVAAPGGTLRRKEIGLPVMTGTSGIAPDMTRFRPCTSASLPSDSLPSGTQGATLAPQQQALPLDLAFSSTHTPLKAEVANQRITAHANAGRSIHVARPTPGHPFASGRPRAFT